MPKQTITYTLEQNIEDFGAPQNSLLFRIRLRDIFKQVSDSAEQSCTNPTPATPTGLSAEQFLETVRLTWTKSSETDLSYYKLYRNTSNDFGTAQLIAGNIPATATAWDDKNPQNGDFYYWIKSVDVFGQESSQSVAAFVHVSLSLLDLELFKIMFTSVSWAQFAIFEAFNSEDKRASPDPSTYDAEVGGGWLDNGGDDTANRAFGFISKTYSDITVILTGTSTSVGDGFLEDTTKSWYDTQYNNLTLIDSASAEFTINDTMASTHRLLVTGTPAAGAYKIKTANADYCLGLCSFLDSTNGGYGYTKLEVSFNGGTNYQTILDTESNVDSRGGTLAVAYPGDNYIVRCTIKNDSNGKGAIMYKFMVFTDPSVWVTMD